MTENTSGASAPIPEPIDEWAFKRYDSLLRYQIYENQTFWTRTQLYLVANTTLLGFCATSRLMIFKPAEGTIVSAATLALVCGIGIVLSEVWRRLFVTGVFWIDRWGDRLTALEERAFGQKVHRDSRQLEPYSIFKTVHFTIGLFFTVWVFFFLYSSVMLLIAIAKEPATAPCTSALRDSARPACYVNIQQKLGEKEIA